jgi:hypothetical protein
LRWAGHVIRRQNEDFIKRIVVVKPEGKSKKGRPRMRWMVWRRIRGTWVWLTGRQKHRVTGENF